MTVTIKFFASLRERFNQEEVQLAQTPATVADAWQAVASSPRPANILAAVNHEYVGFDHPLQPGDEVAFFPPVTGG
ncbi:molybdopterin converting factor subunit 1 [Halothiobacillus sp. DCM-1]|uniref:molybdopterin converting factor subunit 1 n=1 Tax=Halothiobacillus sp. DCM-1 TaxID=3112558 RepID=UPI0032492940